MENSIFFVLLEGLKGKARRKIKMLPRKKKKLCFTFTSVGLVKEETFGKCTGTTRQLAFQITTKHK
jgi:hypothetical protein